MPQKIAQRLSDFDSGKIRSAFLAAKNIPGYIDLGVGFPEEDTPDPIKEAGLLAIKQNRTRYLEAGGLEDLRQAIADKLKSENGISVSPSGICVTPGLTTAILLCYLALLDPGDEVLVPEPYFPPYMETAKLIGARPVPVDTAPDFQLTAQAIEKQISPKSKVLVINSPNNPTGAVYPEAELSRIAQLARRHQLVIISDEIYEYFSWDRPHFSIGSIYEDTLTLNGFSKGYGMTGWRVGYVAGPGEMINAITGLSQYIVFSSSSISQYAALAALKLGPGDIGAKYKAKRDLAKEILAPKFTDIAGAEGAFYIFARLPEGISDQQFVNHLAQGGVIALPGSAFSRRTDYIRLSYAGEVKNIKTGMQRVAESVDILSRRTPGLE